MSPDYPKVLLATTISEHKDYTIPNWLGWIRNLSYPNYDIFLIDNSKDKSYHQKFINMGFKVIHTPIKGREIRHVMAEGDNAIRQKVLDENYDYHFNLECDNFCPGNTIEYLMSKQKQVISLPYFAGLLDKMYILIQENVSLISKDEVMLKVINCPNQYSFLKYMDGEIHKVYGAGRGCMLIQRDVLEKIKYRIDDSQIGYADSFFYLDLLQNRINNFLDTGAFCKHMNMDWGSVIEDAKHF